MICSKCGTPNDAYRATCSNCGEPLTPGFIMCPICGKVLKEDDKVCPRCHSNIGDLIESDGQKQKTAKYVAVAPYSFLIAFLLLILNALLFVCFSLIDFNDAFALVIPIASTIITIVIRCFLNKNHEVTELKRMINFVKMSLIASVSSSLTAFISFILFFDTESAVSMGIPRAWYTTSLIYGYIVLVVTMFLTLISFIRSKVRER